MAGVLRSIPVLLALATLAVRVRTFTQPPEDGNVGLYFYIARDWLNGWLPYTRSWEYKPPGLFALFAAGLLIFRTPTLASAMLSAIAVFCTALALRAIGRSCGGAQGEAIGTIAALFYICLSTEDAGLFGDAQVYVAAFSSWAIYLCAFDERLARTPLLRALGTGLCAGLAMQMKLTALPFAGLLAVLVAYQNGRGAVRSLAVFAAACALPVVPELIVYARAGHLQLLYDANIGATLRRFTAIGGADPRAGNARDAFAQLRVLAPSVELALFALVPPRVRGLGVLWAWLACALLAILLSREYYERMFFELVPPLAILGAIGAVRLGALLRRPRLVAVILVLGAFALHDYFTIRKTVQTAYARSVAHQYSYNREHLEYLVSGLRAYTRGDRSIYVFQESPIVYVYLHARPPTRYAFSADLLEPKLWPMLGFAGERELQRIVAARPHYVLLGRPDGPRDDALTLAQFSQAVRQRYRRVASIDGDPLYRLVQPDP